LRRALPFLGLVIGLWAVVPPYTGPALNTEMRVEIADHVVPSILVLGLSVTALVLNRRRGAGSTAGTFMLLAGMGILLAGFWMIATHVPLVTQSRRGEVPGGTAAYHTAPGIAVTLFGLVWTAVHWNDADVDADIGPAPGADPQP